MRSGASVIQDSLRALAERVPQLRESVFDKLGRMIDASEAAMRDMGEQQVGKASSESQYAMTAANELALMLDETMQKMQSQMQSMMSGQGSCSKPGGASPNASGMKKAQSQLMGQMNKGLQKGQKPGGKQEGKQKGQGGSGLSAQRVCTIAPTTGSPAPNVGEDESGSRKSRWGNGGQQSFGAYERERKGIGAHETHARVFLIVRKRSKQEC